MAQLQLAKSAGSERFGSDPLAVIKEEHALQRSLCDILERIADGLPEDIDPDLAESAANLLETAYRTHVHFEDDQFYPLLRRRAPRDARLIGVLDQLHAEHARDEGFALEIIDELQHLARAGYAANPNMLGYMLRGFFEGQRRQLEWEDALVLPMAEAVLERSDLAELQACLAKREHACRQGLPSHEAGGCDCGPKI
jgi:hemerythrin-like domain-containing protein